VLFRSHREGYADGAQLRDFVYVKDCIAVMLWLMDNPSVSGLFNLGTGKARSFIDLMNAIGDALNKSVNIEFIDMPESILPNYQYFTQANMEKLHAAGLPGLIYSLENGVSDYVTSYLAKSLQYR
jgi:ADP-L-glycero-D-manno-heptose 6-epimerase